MFERFQHEAKAAVVRAQEVARQTGGKQVDTRHLLAALAEGEGPAATALRAAAVDPVALLQDIHRELRTSGLDRDALASVGIDLQAVTERVEEVFGPDALQEPGRRRRHIPFAADAKKALELALREAIRLHERTIDGRHLLLGLVRADCPGRALLARAGVDLPALRRALEEPGARSA